jgi:hypothetical protein
LKVIPIWASTARAGSAASAEAPMAAERRARISDSPLVPASAPLPYSPPPAHARLVDGEAQIVVGLDQAHHRRLHLVEVARHVEGDRGAGLGLEQIEGDAGKDVVDRVALAHDRRRQAVHGELGIPGRLELVGERPARGQHAQVLEDVAAGVGGRDHAGGAGPIGGQHQHMLAGGQGDDAGGDAAAIGPAVGGVDPVADVAQGVAGTDRDLAPVELEGAGERQGVVERRGHGGARHLVGAGDLVDLEGVAGGLGGVGHRDPEQGRGGGRRLGVVAGGGGEGLLGLEHVARTAEGHRTAQPVDRTAHHLGERA